MSGVFPSHDGAGGAFLDEIFTFAFNFVPGGTLGANGQLLSINQNQAVFSLTGTTYGGNGTTNFALPDLGGVTMIGTGQGPGLSPEQLGVRDGTSNVTLTSSELPPDLGGTSQPFSDYQPSLPVTYMICVQGIYPSQGGSSASQDMLSEVMPFAGNFVPADYLPADGRLLSIAQNTALFSLIGTTYGGNGVTTFALPDLRGRTIIGASATDPLGTLVGSPTVSLSNSQAPDGLGNSVQPFDNREPSLALNYIIALNGIFPARDGGGGVDPNTPFLGEVLPFAGTFAPSGWALCNGQLLPINQNQALFALLGTTYGGNGQTTFALPDLRDRTVIGTSASVTIGSQPGANFPTITAAELPQPDLLVSSISGSVSVMQGNNLTFGYVIANQGTATAGSSWAGVYLDGQLASNQLSGPAGYNFISGLASGGTAPETNSFSTAGLAGQHTLWIKADYWSSSTGQSGNGNVVESNETNNWLAFTFNVTAPDLWVASITGPVSVTQGATYSFSYTIQNIGAAAAGMSWAGIYLDQQMTTLPMMGWNQIGMLNPNGIATATNSFSTAGLSVGQHTLWIKADYWNDATHMANSGNNDVVESNENNNWTSVTFNVTAPLLPDLRVASLTVPISVTQGASFGFSYTIQNIGAAAAGSSWEGAYLDGQSDSNKLPGVYNFISGLASGGTAPETNSFSTAGLSVGVHTLWIKADYWNDATGMANSGNNDVVESDETNNWLSLSFNVTASMTSMTSSSSMVVATTAPSSSSTSLAVAPGATVEISSAFDKQATFVGDTGTLKLDDPSSFSGTVAGMSGQDTIDFAGINFATVQSPTYSGDSSGGTLAVTDGTHSANIALLGNYLASTFVASSDGHGGTSVVDPPAASADQHAPLSPPQHA
jgi:microcystin-dependent protein